MSQNQKSFASLRLNTNPSTQSGRNGRQRRRSASLLLAAAATSLFAHDARATAKDYAGSSGGTWSAGPWSPAGTPVNGDVVNVGFGLPANFTLNFDAAYGGTGLASLTIDPYSTGPMTFSQHVSSTMIASVEIIGNVSDAGQVANYVQSAGNNAPATLVIGNASAGNGSYFLTGNGHVSAGNTYLGSAAGSVGTLALGDGANNTNFNAGANWYIGNAGSGSVTLSGGAAAANEIFLGQLAGGSGSFTLSGGSLTAEALIVGNAGAATFTMQGGAINPPSFVMGTGMVVAQNHAATLNLSAGSINFQSVTFGSGGLATVNQSGGFINAQYASFEDCLDTMTAGSIGASTSMTLLGATVNQSGGVVSVGAISGGAAFTLGSGTYNLSGGSLTVLNTVNGYGSINAGGVLNVSAGGTVKADLHLTASGSVSQTGGSVSGSIFVGDISGAAAYTLSAGAITAPTLVVGYGNGGAATGTFTQSGGSINVTGAETIGAKGAVGVFNQSAGSNGADTLTVGSNEYSTPSGTGTYNLTGGLLSVSSYEYIGDQGGVGVFNQTGGTNHALFNLFIGQGGTATYSMSNGATLIVNASEFVGHIGAGTLNQTGGTHTTDDFHLGNSPTAPGTVNLSGGAFTTLSTADIGDGGTGVFNQTGGAYSASALLIGPVTGAAGTYNLAAGSVAAIELLMGGNGGTANTGLGILNLSGGTVSVSGYTQIYGSASGTSVSGLNMTGGTLNTPVIKTADWSRVYLQAGTLNLTGGVSSNAGNFTVGNLNGAAQVNQSGATSLVSIGGSLLLANASNSIGGYLINGGSVTATSIIVGYRGTGTFTHAGGSVTTASDLIVADIPGSSGTYTLSAGSLSVLGTERVAYDRDTAATFIQNGGSHAISGNLNIGDGYSLGDGPDGAQGSYLLTAGTLTVTQNENVGYQLGVGTLTQSGGTHTVSGNLTIGTLATASGTMTLSAGSLRVLGDEDVGGLGSGNVKQTGGTHTVLGTLSIQTNAASVASFALSGGTLFTQNVVNDGVYTQTAGLASMQNVTGTGTLNLGAGGATTLLSVSSFAQLTVNIGQGGQLTVLAATPRVTNTATALTITGTGKLDLSDNNLTTQTPVTTIRSYLHTAYAGGTWSGTSGVFSANAVAAPAQFGIAYVANTSTASVFLRPSLVGDVNLDGKVNGLDTRQIYTSGAFNDGQSNHDWSVGDMNYDGFVNGLDTRAIYTSGNFNNAAQTFAAKLTSPAADPTLNPISVGSPNSGIPNLAYNPNTGDVTFTKNGDSQTVVEILLHSDAGAFNVQNFNASTGATADVHTLDVQSGTGFTTYDFGDVLQTGLTNQQVVNMLAPYDPAHDPSFLGASGFYIAGDPQEHFYDVGTPEPASLSLVGLAALGLVARTRRAVRDGTA